MKNLELPLRSNKSVELNSIDLRLKIKKVIAILNNGLYERLEIIKKTLLVSLAGESIFYLGPPGVAKSLMSRRLKFVYEGCNTFEYLMNRFSTPEELFGPISISKLRDEDKFERLVEGYLPDANIAFLDEIWKAGPSILNTLLTIINEKIYRNGTESLEVPLITLIAASNELPEKNQGLEALWDRFVIRLDVDNVENIESFKGILASSNNSDRIKVPTEYQFTRKELKELQINLDTIIVPERILNILFILRKLILEYNSHINDDEWKIYVSDRRWKKIIKILKTSAICNNRESVNLSDLFLIEDMIWDSPSQKPVIKGLISTSIKSFFKDGNSSYLEIKSKIDKITENLNNLRNRGNLDLIGKLIQLKDDYQIIHFQVNFLEEKNKYPEFPKISYIYNWHNKFREDWIPTVGDVIGLCGPNFGHIETTKIIETNYDVSNSKKIKNLIFKVNILNLPFQLLTKQKINFNFKSTNSKFPYNIKLKEIKDQINILKNNYDKICQEFDSVKNVFLNEKNQDEVKGIGSVMKSTVEKLELLVEEADFKFQNL